MKKGKKLVQAGKFIYEPRRKRASLTIVRHKSCDYWSKTRGQIKLIKGVPHIYKKDTSKGTKKM